mmetsp:Transcript_20118/g.43366  ORF Transcript_20118/g.43366 Transcript_20118/m.43366 type:complete len:867 (+) Transcript_20118:263-2863(+)|eukprot:CAMPEP_0168723468 /NCGR_PEP_ID=MMETSP0724-20121128/3132_1 /TAXON_ID=265536 /ORGANISM="Amphiprora sp., Strain CCMP467" /LENGTH=866 /DNA_ID=CAMNT_0008770179 /DNA_START=386 /DNA_END=2986 /DNA_ORIENTATION=-
MKDEELATLLSQSASLVRAGKRSDPLLNQTLEAFLNYMDEAPKPSRPSRKGTQNTSTMGGMFNKLMKTAMGDSGPDTIAHETPKTEDQKAATSRKNAERAKAELQGEENNKSTFSFPTIPGFTDGDAPPPKKSHPESAPERKARTMSPTPVVVNSDPQQQQPSEESSKSNKGRSEFQRPANPKSALIANGWIEQQRRSRMRTAWKDVLASLVEGRKPGEETTLWIQRQVTNPQTNQTELEALHQIPVKWLEDVTYLDYSADNRFSIKVFNLQEEFIFRCPTSAEAAQDWVSTLLSVRDSRPKKPKSKKEADNNSMTSGVSARSAASGVASPEPRRNSGTTPGTKKSKNRVAAASAGRPQRSKDGGSSTNPFDEEKKSGEQPSDNSPPSKTATAAAASPPEKKHRSIKELRAIAHGEGIQTAGMERKDLEAVVARIEAAQNQPPPPQPQKQQHEQDRKQVERERMEHERRVKEEEGKRKAAAAEEQRRKDDEAARLAEEEAATKQAKDQEEVRRRVAERVHAQQDAERKKREEEERVRLERERVAREEAEHHRRVAEMQERERQEQIRQQQEQYQKQQEEYARRQRAWQEQQAEAARQQQARVEHEARLREEEARRRREAERWTQQNQQAPAPAPYGYPPQQQNRHTTPPPHGYPQQPQQQHYPQQQPQQAYPPHPGAPPHAPPPQHGAYYQQQQPPRAPAPGPPPAGAPPQQQHHAPPPNMRASAVNQKYAKMAEEDEGNKNQKIKHSLLVQWALQPPMMQALKPIEMLITSVHSVFPPSFGVVGHEYFRKWKAVQMEDIAPAGQRVDDDKLNKAVRKLRFFLHPDKLPKDLTSDQSFLIKLLWDITNDAFEEHKKREEDLGWIRS